MDPDYHQSGTLGEIYESTHNYKSHQELPELVLQIKICQNEEEKALKAIKEWFKKYKDWYLFQSDCADLARVALKETQYNITSQKILFRTPQELARDIWDHNQDDMNKHIFELRGSLQEYKQGSAREGFLEKQVVKPLKDRGKKEINKLQGFVKKYIP